MALRILALTLVGLAVLWPVAGDEIVEALKPDEAGCAGAGAGPDPERVQEGRAAVLCLLNVQREGHGLPPFTADAMLDRAAQRHAEDMAERDFFAHENPDGFGPDARIRRAGFEGRTTGENLAWGTGPEATAAATVDGWMHSPGHRANILRRSFTKVGTGLVDGSPDPLVRDRAGIWVNAFGG